MPSAVTGGARSTSRNFSEKRIADESENVKSLTLDDEIRRQIMSDPFANVTFSGGDPMFQAKGFAELARAIREDRLCALLPALGCELLR